MTDRQGSRPLLGVGLAMITVLLFAVGDVLTKMLVEEYPVPVIAAVRYVTSLALMIVILGPVYGRKLWTIGQPVLALLRGGVLAAATLTLGLAFQRMPVGEAVAILYLAPFAVMALAVPIFGERVTGMAWALAALGFAGALLIIRPGGELNSIGVMFALLNAGFATIFHLLTRSLSRTESALALLFWATLAGAVAFSIGAIPHLSGPLPEYRDLWLSLTLGVIATGGHFLFALSYREAPASIIAPVNYMHLVWAAILGFLILGHLPDQLTTAGMALIFFSGVGVAPPVSHGTAPAPRSPRVRTAALACEKWLIAH